MFVWTLDLTGIETHSLLASTALLEFRDALGQFILAHTACVARSVQQHFRDQTEEFPRPDLGQLIVRQLGPIPLTQRHCQTFPEPSAKPMGAGFQHGNTSQQLLLRSTVSKCAHPSDTGMGFGGAAAAA